MPNLLTPNTTLNAANAMITVTGKNVEALIADTVASIFMFVAEKMSMFSAHMHHLRISSGTPSFGSEHSISLRRGGDYLYQTYYVMIAPGIVALDATGGGVAGDYYGSFAPIDNLAHTLDYAGGAAADIAAAIRQPYYSGFAGIMAIEWAIFHTAESPLAKVTNDYMLFVEECLGYAGKSARAMVGKYASIEEACQRAQKSQTWVVPLAFPWTRCSGFALPLVMLTIASATIKVQLKGILDLIVKPAVAESQLTSGGGAADQWGTGRLSLRFRPDTVTWASISGGAAGGAKAAFASSLAILADSHLIDAYLLCNFAFISKAERYEVVSSAFQQFVPVQSTVTFKPTSPAAPADDVEFTAPPLRPNSVVYAFGWVSRRQSQIALNKWDELTAGFDADGPAPDAGVVADTGRDLVDLYILKQVEVTFTQSPRISGAVVGGVHLLHQIQQYQHCSTMSTLHLLLFSFADQMADAQPNGFQNCAKLDDIVATFTIAKEAYIGNTVVVISHINFSYGEFHHHRGAITAKYLGAL